MLESSMPAAKARAAAVLCQVGWLARQSPALQQAILDMGFLKHQARPGPVYRSADSSTALFAVVRGAVRIRFPLADDEFLLHIAGPGFWFGQGPLVTGGQRIVSADADADTVLFEVPVTPLKARLAREPEHWRAIAGLTHEQLVHALRVVAEFLNLPSSARIARRLSTGSPTPAGSTAASRSRSPWPPWSACRASD
jgi:CRP-like cAMP-binding protein